MYEYTVLVVDDEPDICNMMKDILSEGGYKVIIAESGEDALVILENTPNVHLILLDVSMPGLNGLDVLEIIRHNSQTDTIPVIMVTALDQIEYKKRAYALGVNDFLGKPFELEELLLRASTQIQLAESLHNERELNEKLISANEELKNFAYAVSHDLKTPLRGIASLADWIEDDLGQAVNKEVRENLDLLKKRVSKMNRMVEETLQYSRIEKKSYHEDDVYLGLLIDEVIEYLTPPFHFHVRRSGIFPVLHIDRKRITLVFHHLIENAIIYNDKPEAIIEIVGTIDDFGYCIEVKDNGPGIQPQYLKRVFQIFQSMNGNQKEIHPGVGLSIAKKIIEMYDGNIQVISEPDSGASFFVHLPKRLSALSEQGA